LARWSPGVGCHIALMGTAERARGRFCGQGAVTRRMGLTMPWFWQAASTACWPPGSQLSIRATSWTALSQRPRDQERSGRLPGAVRSVSHGTW